MKEYKKILKMDLQRSRKMFIRAALVTALALPLSFAAKGMPVAEAFTLVSLPAFIGIILYGVACFRLYHRYIFADPSYFQELGSVTAERLVLAKLTVAGGWLAVIVAIGALAAGDVSLLSIFAQGLLIITILYLAATASHVKMFSTYKTLAGIFVLVAAYALESDLVMRMKRIAVGLLGGIEEVLAGGMAQGLFKTLGIEFLITAAMMLVNIVCICYLLRYKLYPAVESVK